MHRALLTLAALAWSTFAAAQPAAYVYVPLEARCRVADSRVIASPIPAATTRALNVSSNADFSAQGGSGSAEGCGIPPGARAFAVSLTALPTGQSGFMKIFPGGGVWQDGNTLGFSASIPIANDVIVRANQLIPEDLSIYANVPTHYTVDIVGYFAPPYLFLTQQCTTVSATSAAIAPSAIFTQPAPACDLPYVRTAVQCQSGSWAVPIIGSDDSNCFITNFSGSSITLTAHSRCCRVVNTGYTSIYPDLPVEVSLPVSGDRSRQR